MNSIQMVVVPHSQQRYETAGDWLSGSESPNNFDIVRVSDVGDNDFHRVLMIHELMEMWLCQRAGIDGKAVTAFDEEFEKSRSPDDMSEPGDDPKAPYYRQHQQACIIERAVANILGVDWQKYSDAINSLGKKGDVV